MWGDILTVYCGGTKPQCRLQTFRTRLLFCSRTSLSYVAKGFLKVLDVCVWLVKIDETFASIATMW